VTIRRIVTTTIGRRERGKEVNAMKLLSEVAARIRRNAKAQTMTEYVLIIAAIAVAGYTAYLGLEGGIQTIITNVTATLTGA
jgi:Flp pilus assembly pilin Flp